MSATTFGFDVDSIKSTMRDAAVVLGAINGYGGVAFIAKDAERDDLDESIFTFRIGQRFQDDDERRASFMGVGLAKVSVAARLSVDSGIPMEEALRGETEYRGAVVYDFEHPDYIMVLFYSGLSEDQDVSVSRAGRINAKLQSKMGLQEDEVGELLILSFGFAAGAISVLDIFATFN